MELTNEDLVGRAMGLLRAGMEPYASREFINRHKGRSAHLLQKILGNPVQDAQRSFRHLDTAALLKVMWDSWNDVYRDNLGPAERSLVSELRGFRNRWAHQERFSSDDTYRALDSAYRLLASVSSPQAGGDQ